jgi:hypothetical protein
VDGIPVEFVEVGVIQAVAPGRKKGPATCPQPCANPRRPVLCGTSVGHHSSATGTLGGLVQDQNGYTYILSNNHVIANANQCKVSDLILQPGVLDGGNPAVSADHIGELAYWIDIKFGGSANRVDCALARTKRSDVLREICTVGAVNGIVDPIVSWEVQKHGRSTKLTTGFTVDLKGKIWVHYGNQLALFVDQVVIDGGPKTPFSDLGDSGSVIVDKDGLACALLFAQGSKGHITFANPITRVFKELESAHGLELSFVPVGGA